MSKTIVLPLRNWFIEYTAKASTMNDNQTYHYLATIVYQTTYEGKELTDSDRKSFTTFEDAKAWIDEQLKSSN